jgi:hypothetical protein
MAVGEAGGLAKCWDATFAPSDDAVIWNIAEEQKIVVGEPYRAFQPPKPVSQFFQRGVWQKHRGEVI